MRWSGALATLVALGAYAQLRRYLPAGAEATIVMVILVGLGLAHYRERRRWQRDLRTATSAAPEERSHVIATMDAEHAAAVRLVTGEPHPDASELTEVHEFHYPPASRSLNSWHFWGSALLAAMFVVPVIIGGRLEFADSVVLLIVGGLVMAGAWTYQAMRRWHGAIVRVGPAGIEELSPEGPVRHLAWADVRAVRQPRGLGSLELVGEVKGQSIRIYSELQRFAQCTELIVRHLNAHAAHVA